MMFRAGWLLLMLSFVLLARFELKVRTTVHPHHRVPPPTTKHHVLGVVPVLHAGITDPRSIASSVSQFFGDQIHVHGFVHCDPHPGNMMVGSTYSVPF